MFREEVVAEEDVDERMLWLGFGMEWMDGWKSALLGFLTGDPEE